MRERRYRAWFGGTMHYFSMRSLMDNWGTEVTDTPKGETAPPLYDLCKVMDWTGLHDKNGKEIYEGDIVETWVNAGPAGDYEVRRAVPMDGFGVNIEKWTFDHRETAPVVIGNLYENPELING